jgi:hypothetical protein
MNYSADGVSTRTNLRTIDYVANLADVARAR